MVLPVEIHQSNHKYLELGDVAITLANPEEYTCKEHLRLISTGLISLAPGFDLNSREDPRVLIYEGGERET